MTNRLKITTWNVNGLRAALRNGIWDWIGSYSPDVLCLQEIRVRPEQLTKAQLLLFEDYRIFWNPADRPGYSGVATFVKNDILDFDMGLGSDKFDMEGRVIWTNHSNFSLYNIYFPNGGRDHSRVPYKLDFYAYLLDICQKKQEREEKFVICGDFNTAHQEIDLRNPKENAKTTGFLREERDWIDVYLDHGFVDIFRYMYPEEVKYSWWTYRYGARQRNIGWRLDYFLLTSNMITNVIDVIIHDDVYGSDHCPVTLILNYDSI
jgi:exodeoxyribonuclease-3